MSSSSDSKIAQKDTKRLLLGILIFDEVEVLDFCGPFEVFSITGNLFEGSFEVITVAFKNIIRAKNGLKVVPSYVVNGDNPLPDLDILLIPGGYGTRSEVENTALLDWVKSIEPSLKNVLSVCTGVAILGKCGFIDNMIVTTHRKAFEFVQLNCPKSKLCRCQRFTDNGKFLTSAGISAGIDLSFYFVTKILGRDAAAAVANYMEYDWKDTGCAECVCKF